MKKILAIAAALVLLAVPVAAQEYIPPVDAVVLEMGISDGTNINHVVTLYCITSE